MTDKTPISQNIVDFASTVADEQDYWKEFFSKKKLGNRQTQVRSRETRKMEATQVTKKAKTDNKPHYGCSKKDCDSDVIHTITDLFLMEKTLCSFCEKECLHDRCYRWREFKICLECGDEAFSERLCIIRVKGVIGNTDK
jgi:hypothetical protein